MRGMKAFQHLSYSQGVSLICLGGFLVTVILAVALKLLQHLF
ncbi:DUF4027 family protein [Bacillus cytotoxicus]|nr:MULTISPECIES: DUF4027 family protein [Bacillus cereus group]MDH2860528.1 DUF4027 family protein [Bacillus cytotoxicus]MDH2864900.1 DUF4027 family protein [Bacillus cytotoxicus]MDH2868190.1 DUF4027 family protein [Bacillus cytotoxicus]MDH2872636.1 DUF4027 family protein [Bacillus cytotoxicus]MDH2876746.1 DUF4027 family protein [Bacillus cytotoxicus]